MAIEDTFGYRFVRMSLILLNCLVLIRLISLLLQFPHFFDPTIVLFILLIGSNFMAAIVGAIREHRITVLITGSLTLIMFLSLLFTNKENKNLNLSLFTLLAIAAQSLIFSEMLKERQIFVQRQNLDLWNTATAAAAAGTNSNATNRRTTTANGPLTAVVVYQPSGTNHRGQTTGGIFMVDPILGTELPKDPPPSYFSASCPPPKYEDAIKLNALNIVPTLPQPQQQQQAASSTENQSSDNNNNNQIPSDTSATASSANTSITLSPSSSVDSSVDNNNNNEQQQQQSNNEGSNIINLKNSRKTTETISAAVAAAAAAAATSANAQQQQQQQKQNNDNNSSDDQQQQ